jgi:four helix bundle protein
MMMVSAAFAISWRMDSVELDFARWESAPPPELFGDTIWRLPAYRLSRYLALVVRTDANTIRLRSPSLAEQLERAVDSIGINISEGYGRLHGRERARFYEFALGSAREAREWYARADSYLESGVATGRAQLLTRAIKILTVAIPQERVGSSERRIRDA